MILYTATVFNVLYYSNVVVVGTSWPLKKYILYSMNMGSINEIQMYYTTMPTM